MGMAQSTRYAQRTRDGVCISCRIGKPMREVSASTRRGLFV